MIHHNHDSERNESSKKVQTNMKLTQGIIDYD